MPPSKVLSCLPSDLQYSRRTPFLPRDTARTTILTRPGLTSAWTSRATFPTTSLGPPVTQRSICANATAQHVFGTAPHPASTNHRPRVAFPGHFTMHIITSAANAQTTTKPHPHPKMIEQPRPPIKEPPPPNSIHAPTAAGTIAQRNAIA